MNEKGKITTLIAVGLMIFCAVVTAGCTTIQPELPTNSSSDLSNNNTIVPVTILADYRDKGYSGVIQVPTFTEIDDEANLYFYNSLFDGNYAINNTKDSLFGLCSSCIKTLNDNKTVLGRNVDYPNTNAPIVIFYVNASDRYHSVNIGHTVVIPFDHIVEINGMEKQFYEKLPYLITDSMNECGLILEVNMREKCEKLDSSSTNPNGHPRICFMNLIRYLSDHCANIDEVLNTVKDLDIYSANSSLLDWHGGIAMMDATGRYGVLEIANNKILWSENMPGQTNFWQNKEAYSISDLNSGLGRWDVLMNEYANISSEKDMENVMKKVSFEQLYTKDLDDLPYDPRTEETDASLQEMLDSINEWIQKYDLKYDKEKYNAFVKLAKEQTENNITWTTSYVLDPKNKEKVEDEIRIYNYFLTLIPNEERKLTGDKWISLCSYVVNNKDLIYHMKFFEQDDVFDIPLNP